MYLPYLHYIALIVGWSLDSMLLLNIMLAALQLAIVATTLL